VLRPISVTRHVNSRRDVTALFRKPHKKDGVIVAKTKLISKPE